MDTEGLEPSAEDKGLTSEDMKPSGLERSDKPQPGKSESETPGKGMKPNPMQIEGKYYDPWKPPKLYRFEDGKDTWRGGKEISRDEAYSMVFWNHDQPAGLKNAMEGILDSAFKEGRFDLFVGTSKNSEGNQEIDQESKEKLSAYRILAREMGHNIGALQYHENAGTVTAPISKIEATNK